MHRSKVLYTLETKLLLFELGCYKFKLIGINNKNHKTEKIHSYMAEITCSFSVITLNDNRVTIPNKKQRQGNGLRKRKRFTYTLSIRDSLQIHLKVKR